MICRFLRNIFGGEQADLKTEEETVTEPSTNNTTTFTNDSGGDVTLLVVSTGFDPKDGVTSVPGANLEVTQAGGSDVLKSGASGAVTLDRTVTNKDKKQVPVALYDFYVSDAKTFLPVANCVVSEDWSTFPAKWTAPTISADDRTAMKQAQAFYQTIQALPSSKLVKGYQKAMTQTTTAVSSAANGTKSGSDVAGGIMKSVNQFFAHTKNFNKMTQADLTMVNKYYQTFPQPWGPMGEDDRMKSYYLYSAGGSAKASFVGKLDVTKPAAPNVTAENCGYLIEFFAATDKTDLTGAKVSDTANKLTFSNGQFSDGDGASQKVALQGIYALESKMSGKMPADLKKDVVKEYLTGTIAEEKVLGLDAPMPTPPITFGEVVEQFFKYAGYVMTIVFIGQMVHGLYKWAKSKKNPTQEELDAEQTDQLSEARNAERTASEDIGRDSVGDDLDSVFDSSGSVSSDVGTLTRFDSTLDGLESSSTSFSDLAQYEASSDFPSGEWGEFMGEYGEWANGFGPFSEQVRGEGFEWTDEAFSSSEGFSATFGGFAEKISSFMESVGTAIKEGVSEALDSFSGFMSDVNDVLDAMDDEEDTDDGFDPFEEDGDFEFPDIPVF